MSIIKLESPLYGRCSEIYQNIASLSLISWGRKLNSHKQPYVIKAGFSLSFHALEVGNNLNLDLILYISSDHLINVVILQLLAKEKNLFLVTDFYL